MWSDYIDEKIKTFQYVTIFISLLMVIPSLMMIKWNCYDYIDSADEEIKDHVQANRDLLP